MKPPFTSTQEMYNYAANQLMNQNLSPGTVKNNLMERGVTDADAETVVQNMLVVIEKRRKGEGSASEIETNTAEETINNHGSFATSQEMYNYAANQLIVQKLSQQTVRRNLINKGVSDAESDNVIANMMIEIEKNRPAQTSTSARPKNRTTSSTGSFANEQDMYNYAADQLIVKKFNQKTVRGNLISRGVSDAQADTVIANMMVEIEKGKPVQATTLAPAPGSVTTSTGSFATSQDMYNYAADLLIVRKLNQQTVKNNLIKNGLSPIDADVVIKNMIDQIAKNKPAKLNAKRAEGKRMMLMGSVIFVIGLVLYGANFTIAGETFVFSYGIMAVGAIFFFKGVFKMF